MKIFISITLFILLYGINAEFRFTKYQRRTRATTFKPSNAYKKFLQRFRDVKNMDRYDNATLVKIREEHFQAIAPEIDQHNELYDMGILPYKRAPQRFSDWSTESKFKNLCGTRLPPRARAAAPSLLKVCKAWPKAPDDVNNCNFPNNIRDQLTCGCCWAFSVIQVTEAQIFMCTGKQTELSVQQLVDCDNENQACDGGWPALGFRHIQKTGAYSMKTYSYKNEKDDACKKAAAKKVLEREYVRKYLEVELKGDEECLKKIIHKVGPVAIAVHATEPFMSYDEGFYVDSSCPKNDPNHAMVLCGYGTDDVNGDYWLIRNSWGPLWGENGYVRMARNNTCGVASYAMWPVIINCPRTDPFTAPGQEEKYFASNENIQQFE